MGTKKVREMEMRKLQATGRDGESYMITLPKELVQDLKWRKRQKLTVSRDGKGQSIITKNILCLTSFFISI